jgi:CheY-like chemotaxis protein
MLTTSTATRNENWIEVLGIKSTKVPVLIVGNNPIEMTSIYNILVGFRLKSYLTDVCFDLKDSFERISKSRPEVLLVDDNLGSKDIQKMVLILKNNLKTRNIKVIVLKSSNRSFQVIDNVDDYILKDSINAKTLDRIIDKNLHPIIH